MQVEKTGEVLQKLLATLDELEQCLEQRDYSDIKQKYSDMVVTINWLLKLSNCLRERPSLLRDHVAKTGEDLASKITTVNEQVAKVMKILESKILFQKSFVECLKNILYPIDNTSNGYKLHGKQLQRVTQEVHYKSENI
ncbi:MAG: hypothetical protein AAF153_01155 [Pseudomonadota bacterium]